jgi:formate C-acetyltransferase
MGLATVADSLAAVRKLVFEEKAVDYDRLMEALDENFAGFEPLRQMLINRAPKYGNADPYVDDIAAQLVARAADACLQHTMPDGGRFVAAMAANITNIAAGREVPATPDGRFAGTPLSDAASPFFGRDRNGPTAFLASVATPDYSNVLTGSVVNMKFEPDCFAGKEGADRFEALTQHFVRDRIQQLQFNATGNETLLKARNRPGDFPNLVVRVSGFSAYFVNLAPEVQEDVIRRRAHRLIPSEASD